MHMQNLKANTVRTAFCALLVSFALVFAGAAQVAVAPTNAYALDTAKCTAKPNVSGSSDVLGGVETRITWEGQADPDEQIAGVTFTLPEGTTCEPDDTRATMLTGDDLMTRTNLDVSADYKDGKLTVNFSEPAQAGGYFRVEIYKGKFSEMGGDMQLTGAYTLADGTEVAMDTLPAITVKSHSFFESLSDSLAQQDWVKSWNSVLFLKLFLNPLIPDYMMPSFFVHLEKMPVTPGGKIDKKALPVPEVTTTASTAYVEPVTAVQIKLCEIFEKALGIEKVGIEDNFFELGGSSLTASKVAVMCLSKNISIVYADIFKYPTIRELSAIVDNSEAFENPQSENEFSSYNYNRIQSVISGNVEENVNQVTKEEIGDIMITGATGFLGIHVLKAYLDNYDGKVYCLVRKGKYESMEKRMMHMLMYYFDNPCQELFGERIICVDGDITSKEQVEKFADYKFNTIINCAACVKHFAAGDVLEKINVHGVENLIEFCKNNGRRLIQISTVSVAGEGSDGVPPMSRVFNENDLYIGQNITNEYIRTKFLAERAVLEAVSSGLDGKVIRVGNLMSRNSDGEFQINFITNGFLRSLRGYEAVGKFPIGAMHEVTEFSPIDSTALAVLRLVQTDRRFTVFHACNSHHIYMADLIYAMRSHGFDIDIVSDEEFEAAVKEFAKNSDDSDVVSGLIAYTAHNENEIYTLDYSNRFTAQVLYRLDYKWPVTDDRYLESAIEALDRLAFFD